MKNVIINEELIQGKPKELIEEIKNEMIYQIKELTIEESNYEMFSFNLELFAQIVQLIGDNKNEEIITLKYNPMGSWYIEEENKGAK